MGCASSEDQSEPIEFVPQTLYIERQGLIDHQEYLNFHKCAPELAASSLQMWRLEAQISHCRYSPKRSKLRAQAEMDEISSRSK